MSKGLSFAALLFSALVLVPGMAHLLEMPHKMQLTQESYGTVQYIYGGWAILGVFQIAAIVFSLLLYFRGGRPPLALVAAALLACTLGIFFIWTYPVNRVTQNWSLVPENWETLRIRWEYSHAAGALLELIAYILLLFAVLWRPQVRQPGL
ncbi:MAG TPA: hypothetical protein VHC48_18765 [Puia sp.]|nr:hypothetical protein [Puia sp.]